MSTPAIKQKKPSAEEPNKKAKRTEMIRAFDGYYMKQEFFEVDDLEEAKQWLLDQYNTRAQYSESIGITSPSRYCIERYIARNASQLIFKLTDTWVIWMNNERAVKLFQKQVPDELTDKGVQKILQFIEKSKQKLQLIDIEEDGSESDSD